MTIRLLYVSNNIQFRTVKELLAENNVSFVEQNLKLEPLTMADLRHMLLMSVEPGYQSFIREKKVNKKLLQFCGRQLDDMKPGEVLEFINAYPAFLRLPIVLSEEKISFGKNMDEITSFIPKYIKREQTDFWIEKARTVLPA